METINRIRSRLNGIIRQRFSRKADTSEATQDQEKQVDSLKINPSKQNQQPDQSNTQMIHNKSMASSPVSSTVTITGIKKKEKCFWLTVLILSGAIYYSFFVRSIVPPQTGWWQYMAQRLSEGGLLYRDVFMYVPPYFAWFTTFLYQIFGNHLILYTLFGLVFFRVTAWAFLYLLSIRFARPWVAAVSVLIGICITSSYLMDQAYDYNPITLELTIIQAYLIVRIAETKRKRLKYILIVVEGFICGLELMLKQNIGLVMPIVTLLVIVLLTLWNSDKRQLKWNVPIFALGILTAVLPGLLYLFFTGTADDCWRCLIDAIKAKSGTGNILLIAIRNFVRPLDLSLAAFFAFSYCSFSNPAGELHQYRVEIIVMSTSLVVMTLYRYIVALLDLLLSRTIVMATCVILIVCMGIVAWIYKKHAKSGELLPYQSFCILFIILLICLSSTATNTGAYLLYYGLDWPSLKTHFLYILLYLNIFIWFAAVYQTFRKRDDVAVQFVLVYIIFFGFLAVSFASASLEELYALLMTPAIFMAVEHFGSSFGILKSGNVEVMKDVLRGRMRLQTGVIVVCGVLCIFCFVQKLYMPYEWHSWRTGSLLGDQADVISVPIEGLEGFRLDRGDVNTYQQIIELIEANSDEDDILYQFPNIPLFNVLTNRKSVYAAIPYFDVCSDALAEESARQLQENPPELVLWSELGEWRWIVHEIIFRSGNPSGQRALQKFYENVVKNEYTLLGTFDNNDSEIITLWKKS